MFFKNFLNSKTFFLQETNPIEAIYMFPIEEEAAVVNFTAELDGRTIKTEVRKKEEAKAAYDKAMQVRTCLENLYLFCTFSICVL